MLSSFFLLLNYETEPKFMGIVTFETPFRLDVSYNVTQGVW